MKSQIIDMHCDTLMLSYLKRGADSDIYEAPDLSIDVKSLKEGGAMAQFLAIFMLPRDAFKYFGAEPVGEEEYIAGCAKVFHNTMERHPEDIAPAATAEEIEKNWKEGKVSGVLTMEDGVAVHGDMKKLDALYDMGIRALSLTWNFENCFGAPNSKDPKIMEKGLTDFGKEAVLHMQEIGMLVDVSHLSDGGFYDVASLCKKPFAATHSNCRELCRHPRNMTDDMIKVLAEHGGVMGINFSPEFLDETPGNTKSRVDRMVAMAVHERKVGGIDVIGMGTDFDGIEGDLEVAHPSQMDLLLDGLSKAGFTENEIDKITHENVLRVMKEAVH